jgi:glycosyltransferase involved in cell wall biosynthesis
MSKILHLIDRNTPTDMLRQLSLVADESTRIISIGPAPDYPLPAPVECWREFLGSAVMCGLRYARLVEDADIVHTWSPRAQRAGEILVGRSGAALVRSLPAVPPGGKDLHRLVLSVVARDISITVPTEANRDKLAHAGINPNQIHLLPPAAAPIDNRVERRTAFRHRMGLPADAFVMVMPDAIIRPANPNMAAWAHAIMRYVLDDRSWLLTPAGGAMARAFSVFATGAGFVDEILGPWEPAEFDNALAAADVAVFFRQADCGCTAIASSMAAGLPIVAFDTPDLIECAAESALLTAHRTPRAAGAALLRLIEEPDLAATLAQASIARATDFTPPQARKTLEDLHTRLLATVA